MTEKERNLLYGVVSLILPENILLIADSQNRYKGVLRDWFRLESISPSSM